jgi:hypothetical protein
MQYVYCTTLDGRMTAELERISKKEVVFWGNIPEFSWSE